MAKDYAKRVFTTTRTRKKKRMRVEWFIVPILVIIGALGYWVWRSYTSEHLSLKKSWSAKKAPLMAAKSNPEQPNVHFDFYNELPNVQMNQLVESAPADEISATKPPALVDMHTAKNLAAPIVAGAFIIDLGVYKTSSEASEQRISLLLSGCEAEVIKLTDATGDSFRIQRGPYVSEAEAKKLLGQLLRKGITGEIKKV